MLYGASPSKLGVKGQGGRYQATMGLSVLRPSTLQMAAQHHVDLECLEHYYDLLSENERKLIS